MTKYLSSSLLLTLLALMGVGLVQVYSSSYVFAIEYYNDGLFFFKKQLLFTIIGMAAMMGMIWIPIDKIKKYGWMSWFVAAGLIVLTMIPGIGVKVGGAYRWIQVPLGFRIEPAEILKLTFVLLLATFITRYKGFQLKRLFSWSLCIFIPMILVLKQPDFGTFALIMAVGFCLLFAFGLPWAAIIATISVAIPAFYVIVMSVSYRRDRVLAFLDPWSEAHQKGFQVIQSMLSFHSGGLWGSGLGQGQGKLFFLPEAHTDFTLAVLGEEMGFMGLFVVMSLYGFLVFRCFQLSLKTDDKFQKAVCLGIALTFGLTVIINAGMSMGLLPTKGMALPFLSYGGSSLIASCVMFGLMLNLEHEILNSTKSQSKMAELLEKSFS